MGGLGRDAAADSDNFPEIISVSNDCKYPDYWIIVVPAMILTIMILFLMLLMKMMMLKQVLNLTVTVWLYRRLICCLVSSSMVVVTLGTSAILASTYFNIKAVSGGIVVVAQILNNL